QETPDRLLPGDAARPPLGQGDGPRAPLNRRPRRDRAKVAARSIAGGCATRPPTPRREPDAPARAAGRLVGPDWSPARSGSLLRQGEALSESPTTSGRYLTGRVPCASTASW